MILEKTPCKDTYFQRDLFGPNKIMIISYNDLIRPKQEIIRAIDIVFF